MKWLLVLALVALAGCGVPSDLPICDKNAPADYTRVVLGWSGDTAKALADKGWTIIHTNTGSGLVVAECHASDAWKEAHGIQDGA